MKKWPSDQMVSSVHGLLTVALSIVQRHRGATWWRGQGRVSWSLQPSVFRRGRDPRDERNLIAQFRLQAPSRYDRHALPAANASWLFLMQHYRLPTRLLDWTESPLVAAFFAARSEPKSDAAIWALNPVWLNRDTIESETYGTQGDPRVRPLFEAAYRGELDRSAADVVAVVPDEVDFRLLAQLGRVTVHNATSSLEARANAAVYLDRIVVPRAAKKRMMAELHMLGIREANLFPDLEHLAIDLAARSFRYPRSKNASA